MKHMVPFSKPSLTIAFPFAHPLQHHLHRGNACNTRLLDGERGRAVGEFYGLFGIAMLVQMGQEGGSKDITRPCRIDFLDGIGRKALRLSFAKEGSTMTAIGGNKERHMHAPAGQNSITIVPIAIGKRE